MMPATTRPATGVRGARPWRLLVVLTLVAACALLTVPGVAGAHVKAKYRTQYKRQLTLLNKTFTTFANSYDNLTADSRHRAEIMEPMVGNPAQRDTLLQHEKAARDFYDQWKDLPMQLSMQFSKSINTFKAKAKRYFATAKQQRLFKKRCELLKSYASFLMWLANDHAYESYKYLGQDPPAFQASAKALEDADADAATGHEGWDAQRAKLRAML
jgi:hypothetical protein